MRPFATAGEIGDDTKAIPHQLCAGTGSHVSLGNYGNGFEGHDRLLISFRMTCNTLGTGRHAGMMILSPPNPSATGGKFFAKKD
tara:strand:- start:158 stop:409 length:252 start_codon:yes stop_codon:yes gene_type:complete